MGRTSGLSTFRSPGKKDKELCQWAMCLQPLQEVFCSNSSGIILIPHFPHALFPGFILLLNISIVRVAAHTHSPGNIYFLQGLFHSIRIYRCIKCPFRTILLTSLISIIRTPAVTILCVRTKIGYTIYSLRIKEISNKIIATLGIESSRWRFYCNLRVFLTFLGRTKRKTHRKSIKLTVGTCGAYDKLIQFYSLIHCNTSEYFVSFNHTKHHFTRKLAVFDTILGSSPARWDG